MAKEAAREAAASVTAAQQRAKAAAKRLASARRASETTTRRAARITADLRVSSAKVISKVERRGAKQVRTLEAKVSRASKAARKAAAALDKAKARLASVPAITAK